MPPTVYPGAPLTPRELACLDAYGRLWDANAVAAELRIARSTVKNHLANVRTKYDVNRTGLALAIRARELASST